MPTVIDDNTGEEVEVRPTHAVAAMASINSVRQEYPKGSAEIIQNWMANAAAQCAAQGITEPDAVREAMLSAREGAKKAIKVFLQEQASQEEAKQREAEAQEK